MNRNSYLNIITTLLLLLCAGMSVLLITALDQLRFRVEELTASVRNLETKFADVQINGPQTGKEAAQQNRSGANAHYYDPDAKKGGTLRLAFAADMGNMNMLISNDAYVSMLWGKCHDSLAERDFKDLGDGRFQPMLAEYWEQLPDRKTIRVKLRKGVLWHDFTDPVTGKQWQNQVVTAQDVKFFVDVLKNPDVDAAPLRVYYNDLEEIRILNDYEFEAVWRKPYFMMLDMTLGLMPLPRHLYHAYPGPFDGKLFNNDHRRNRMIVGCGPYQFDRWEKGKRILLKRFGNYYGTKIGLNPAPDAISIEIIQHPNTRLLSLLSKELDFDGLTPDQWINRTSSDAFGKQGFLRKISYPGWSYSYIGLNQKNPLFRDKRVRQALSHLVNREKLLKDVFHGLAQSVSGPFPAEIAAYDSSIHPYEFNVEKAKELLKAAGWQDNDGDGILEKEGRKFRFTLIYPNVSTTFQKMIPVIREDMAKAGVDLQVLGIEWSVLVQRLEQKQFDACSLAWTGSLKPDPYQLWHSSQAEVAASSNHIGFINPEADRLIEQIRTEFDPAKQKELYHAFHKLIHEEEPYLFLFSPMQLVTVNRRIQNVRVFPNNIPSSLFWIKPE